MIGSAWTPMRAPAGAAFIRSSCRPRRSYRLRTQAMVDSSPSVAHLVDALHNTWVVALNETATHLASKLLVLGDADVAVAVTNSFTDKVDTAGQVAQQSGESGPIAFVASGFENFLQLLDSGLEKLGVPYSYGFAIILLTVIVKVATYPLAKQQVESTMAMQALQPKVKELQAQYANDQEKLQLETAQLYRDAQVNPLAGCLPLLIQLPVFIGLYRALTKVASDGLLTEGFFWVPSLGGPTSADAQGMAWLFPFVDGHPPLGWESTGAYLSLPVLLVVSQFLSQKIMAPPPSDDPAQQQTQAILRFIPLMIGYFSLNVPSGLSLYWLTNNFITTAQQVYLKSTTKVSLPDLPSSSTAKPQPVVNATASSEEKVKKLTGQEMGATQRGGEKFRARKAREAAGKEAASAVVVEASVDEGKPKPGDRFRQRKARTVASASPEPPAAAPSTAGPVEAKAEEPPQAPPAITAVVPEVVGSTAENGTPKRSSNAHPRRTEGRARWMTS